ncbi:dentin sialophosphoprotein-like isoform X2 [Liolophura sinensis]|uniref:dentin sialophosphoprotein-like isoform X2 n=1 Tax=Liolophura sinensis TaxID=3198878 RepID=UPI00315894D4
MEDWVRQLFAGTKDFSSLSTRKVRLIYENETGKVLSPDEKLELKQIIIKLLPDFLSYQAPQKSGDKVLINRGREGEETNKEDCRVFKQDNKDSNVVKKTKSNKVVKGQDDSKDGGGRNVVQDDGEDDGEDVINGHDDVEGKKLDNGKYGADDDHKYKPSSLSEEERAQEKSPEKELEHLSSDASIVTTWKLKEARSTKKYSGIKRPKRIVSMGEAMEEMNLKLNELKPCCVRLYDIRTESGSGSSGEILKGKTGRRLSLAEWRTKAKRKRVISASSGSGSDHGHRGFSPKQKQKAKKVQKGNSRCNSSDEDCKLLKTKKKESDSNDSESVGSDSDICRVKGMNKGTKKPASASDSEEEGSSVKARHSVRNCSVLLEKAKTTKISINPIMKMSKKRKTVDSDSTESTSDGGSFTNKRPRRSSARTEFNRSSSKSDFDSAMKTSHGIQSEKSKLSTARQRIEFNRSGSDSEFESAKKTSPGKKSVSERSELPVDWAGDESDSDFIKPLKAVTKKRSQRKRISLESDNSDSNQSDSQTRIDKRQQRIELHTSDESVSKTSSLTNKSRVRNKSDSKRSMTNLRSKQASYSDGSSSSEEVEGLFNVLQSEKSLTGKSDDEPVSKIGKTESARVNIENIDSDSDWAEVVTVKALSQAKKGSPARRKLEAAVSPVRSRGKEKTRGGVKSYVLCSDTSAVGSDSATSIGADSDSATSIDADSDSATSIDADSESDSERGKSTTKIQRSRETQKSLKVSNRKERPLKQPSKVDDSSERSEEFDIKPCVISLVDIVKEKSFPRVSETTFLVRNVIQSHKTGSKLAFCANLVGDDNSDKRVTESPIKRSPCRKTSSPTELKTTKEKRKCRMRFLVESTGSSESDSDFENVQVSPRRVRRSGTSGNVKQRIVSESDSDFEPAHGKKPGALKSKSLRQRLKYSVDRSGSDSVDGESGDADSRGHGSSRRGKKKIRDDKGIRGRDQPAANRKCREDNSYGRKCRSSTRKSSISDQRIENIKQRNISRSNSDTCIFQSSDEGSDLIVETVGSPSRTPRGKHKSDVIRPSDEGSDLIVETVGSPLRTPRGKHKSDVIQSSDEGCDLIVETVGSPSRTPRGKHKSDVIQSSDEGSDLIVETVGSPSRTPRGKHKSDVIQSSDEGSDLIVETVGSRSQTPRGKHKSDVIRSSDEGSDLIVETVGSPSRTPRGKHKSDVIQSSDEGSDLIVETVGSRSQTPRGKHKSDVIETKESKIVIARRVMPVSKKKSRGSESQDKNSGKKTSKLEKMKTGEHMDVVNNKTDFTDSDSDSLPETNITSKNSDSKQACSGKQVQKKLLGSCESDFEISTLVSEISAKHLCPKKTKRKKEEMKLNSSSSKAHSTELLTDSDATLSELESLSPRRGAQDRLSPRRRSRDRLSKKQAECKLKKQIQMQQVSDTSSSAFDANDERLFGGNTCNSKPTISPRIVSDSESSVTDVEAVSNTKRGKNRKANVESRSVSSSSVESVRVGSSVNKVQKAVDADLHNSDIHSDDTSCLHSRGRSPQMENLTKKKTRSPQSGKGKTEKRNNRGKRLSRKGIENDSDDKDSSKKNGRKGHSDDESHSKSGQDDGNDVDGSDDSGNISPDETEIKALSSSSTPPQSPSSSDSVELRSEPCLSRTEHSDLSVCDSGGPGKRTSPGKHTGNSPAQCILIPAEIHVQKEKSTKADDSDVDTSSLSESELRLITVKEQPAKVLKKKKSVFSKPVKNSAEKVKQSEKTKSKKGASKEKKDKRAAPDKYSEKLKQLVTICKAMGLSYSHRVRGCNSDEKKVEQIQDYLEECGMKGRTSRSQGLFSSHSKSPRKQTSPVLKLDRLKDIIDSEGSSD